MISKQMRKFTCGFCERVFCWAVISLTYKIVYTHIFTDDGSLDEKEFHVCPECIRKFIEETEEDMNATWIKVLVREDE